jgi:arsenite-transporting ATPase
MKKSGTSECKEPPMPGSKPKYLFFTGKGGVGKTSLACATAIEMADAGKTVLLVSTDPASNLKDVLESPVDEKIKPVNGIERLFATNINPEKSAGEYRSRVIQNLNGIATETEIAKIRENLSGACTTEIASFDEFSRFISGENEGGSFDVIVFDTAPTGHTLRLLELPAAWSGFTDKNPAGASCLGPASALKSGQERYHTVVSRLRDIKLTRFIIVSRADKYALKEASRTSSELSELGMGNQMLYINAVFKARDKNDPIARKIEEMSNEQLHSIPGNLKNLPLKTFPLLSFDILGISRLRWLLRPVPGDIISEISPPTSSVPELPNLQQLVDELCKNQNHGLVLTMGKGGVGKTIFASTIAILLAKRGFEVLLTTTDPAAHVQDFIGQLQEVPENLTVERIDPKVETRRYTEKIMELRGHGQSEEAKKLIQEDLKSPCTEEVAVFHAFSKAISTAKRKFVVIDTAPTGHTLLLLDTTGSYHRDILRNNPYANRIRTPLMALQDPDFSKVILITLPETTPMREAGDLQADLKRAGITPYAWLINQCVSMLPEITDPLLKIRAQSETSIIDSIKKKYAEKVFGIPFIAEKNLLPALLNKEMKHISSVGFSDENMD